MEAFPPPNFPMFIVTRGDTVQSLILMAVEFRENEWYDKLPKLDCTVVSIDSPIGTYIVNTSGKISLRMHGREDFTLLFTNI